MTDEAWHFTPPLIDPVKTIHTPIRLESLEDLQREWRKQTAKGLPVNKLDERIQELIASKEVHKQYLSQKLTDQDWHGVADAAMDLRDIEAELKGLRMVKNDS